MDKSYRAFHISGILLLITLTIVITVSLLIHSAAVGAAEKMPPNIIFIVVDALRADHVSSYGYTRPTTPNLDSWIADQGALFSDTTAASSWTNPSNGAMLTSQLPSSIDTVWSDMQRSLPEDEVLLAEYLHDAGYYTAGFVSNWWLRAMFGYDQGFDVYQNTTGENATRAFAINGLAVDWLDINLAKLQSGGQPLFLFLYYLDPHTWYDPPPPYDVMYDNTYTGSLTAEIYGHGKEVVAGNIVPSERDIEHLLALYDGEITHWDFYLGQMFEYLQAKGVLQNSIIVVTSDHGQMFGEHGKWIHRNSLYEEVLRIPLLFRYTGTVGAGQVLDTPVSNMDITPTLLDMAGIPVPGGMQGQSLLPLMQGGAAPDSREIFSEMDGETDPNSDGYWIAPHTNLYSVKQNGWKLIHAQEAPQEDQLFEVRPNSIYEGDNLAGDETQKRNALFSILQDEFGVPTNFLFLPLVEGD